MPFSLTLTLLVHLVFHIWNHSVTIPSNAHKGQITFSFRLGDKENESWAQSEKLVCDTYSQKLGIK